VAIHLLDPNQEILELKAQRGFSRTEAGSLAAIPLNPPTLNWFQQSELTTAGAEFAAGIVLPEPFCLPRYKQMLPIQLRTRGRPQGSLTCYRVAEQPFSANQAALLRAMAEQVGIILENFRLREEAQELAAMLERQRLARELHDSVSQSLYSLTLFARAGQDALDEGNLVKLRDNLLAVEQNSKLAQRDMRLLLYQLRTEALEERLVQALEIRFQQVERRLGIRAKLEFDPEIHLTPAVEQELFWLITEALNNATKHAQADEVVIQLRGSGKELALSICDNGTGFDVPRTQSGMGLQGMRERAAILGGQLEIASRSGKGTCIRVNFPYNNT
jgi:signal transduction histidine kinase